jgi:hypothetical protein
VVALVSGRINLLHQKAVIEVRDSHCASSPADGSSMPRIEDDALGKAGVRSGSR